MSTVTLESSDYPLSINRPDLLTTPTGKPFAELTMESVIAGDVQAEDLRCSADTLRLQATISDSVGRPQLAANLRRAAELTALSDERLLQIYNALRPNASTKDQLLEIATELESTYHAPHTAALVREAADVYERRGVLAEED